MKRTLLSNDDHQNNTPNNDNQRNQNYHVQKKNNSTKNTATNSIATNRFYSYNEFNYKENTSINKLDSSAENNKNLCEAQQRYIENLGIKGKPIHFKSYFKLFDLFYKTNQYAEAERVFIEHIGNRADYFIENTMLSIYADQGDINKTQQFYQDISVPNPTMKNTMLKAYINKNLFKEANAFYEQMIKDNEVNEFTESIILNMYVKQGDMDKALIFYKSIIKNNEHDIFNTNTMLKAYVDKGIFDKALAFYKNINKPNTVSKNIMLKAYIDKGIFDEALAFYKSINNPNIVSKNTMLKAYVDKDLHEALIFYNGIPKKEADHITENIMLKAYINKNLFKEANAFYKRIYSPHIFTQNIMLNAYVEADLFDEAKAFYEQMNNPNTVSKSTMLKAYIYKGFFKEAIKFYQNLARKNEIHITAKNIMINAYVDRGYFDEALEIYKNLGKNEADITTKNTIIKAYVDRGFFDEAIKLYQNLLENNEANIFTKNTIIKAYVDQGLFDEAIKLYQNLLENDEANIFTKNTIIKAYADRGCFDEALKIYKNLGKNEADIPTKNIVIKIYVDRGLFHEALKIYKSLRKNEASNGTENIMARAYNYQSYFNEVRNSHQNSLGVQNISIVISDMIQYYAYKGAYTKAKKIFSSTPADKRDFICYSAMSKEILNHFSLSDLRFSEQVFNEMVKLSQDKNNPDAPFQLIIFADRCHELIECIQMHIRSKKRNKYIDNIETLKKHISHLLNQLRDIKMDRKESQYTSREIFLFNLYFPESNITSDDTLSGQAITIKKPEELDLNQVPAYRDPLLDNPGHKENSTASHEVPETKIKPLGNNDNFYNQNPNLLFFTALPKLPTAHRLTKAKLLFNPDLTSLQNEHRETFDINDPNSLKELENYFGNQFKYDDSYDKKYSRKLGLEIRYVYILGQYGIFTKFGINATYKPLGFYMGDRITGEKAKEALRNDTENQYIYSVTNKENKEELIDANTRRNWAGFLNHSNTPNLRKKDIYVKGKPFNSKKQVAFYAMGSIGPDQQLTQNYMDLYFNDNNFKPFYLHSSDDWKSYLFRYTDKKEYYLSHLYQVDDKTKDDLGLASTLLLIPSIFIDIKNNNITALRENITQSQPYPLNELIAYCATADNILEPTSQQHITPLMYACYLRKLDIVDLLIDKDADVDRLGLQNGYSPLMLLLLSDVGKNKEGIEKTAIKLFKKMQTPFSLDAKKFNILHYAIKCNLNQLIKEIFKRTDDSEYEPVDIVTPLFENDLPSTCFFDFCILNNRFETLGILLNTICNGDVQFQLADTCDDIIDCIQKEYCFKKEILEKLTAEQLTSLHTTLSPYEEIATKTSLLSNINDLITSKSTHYLKIK